MRRRKLNICLNKKINYNIKTKKNNSCQKGNMIFLVYYYFIYLISYIIIQLSNNSILNLRIHVFTTLMVLSSRLIRIKIL